MQLRASQKDQSPENFALLQHMALNLLNLERTAKCGIKAKRNTRWME